MDVQHIGQIAVHLYKMLDMPAHIQLPTAGERDLLMRLGENLRATRTARRVSAQAARSCGGRAAASGASWRVASTSRPTSVARRSASSERPTTRSSQLAAIRLSRAMSPDQSVLPGTKGCSDVAQLRLDSKRGVKPEGACIAQALRPASIIWA